MSTGSVPGTHDQAQTEAQAQEERNCFYCLSGYVFIGTLDHDGEEIVESYRCRRCSGTGVLTGGGEARG